MFSEILEMQKTKKYLVQGAIVFVVFLGLYIVLDQLNIGYSEMIEEYGLFLVVINIVINFFLAGISALMWNVSTALVSLTGKEGKGTFFSGFAYLFGLLTYGCTPCVIAFFSTIGITFAVAALPLAGLPYKFISILLLVIGFFLLRYEANHVKCKIK
jgi:hypothetical protein